MADLGPLDVEEGDEFIRECPEILGELEDFEEECEEDSPIADNLRHHVIFNKKRHLADPVLIPDMVFGTSGEFKDFMRHYGIRTRRPVGFPTNESSRVGAMCKVKGCTFRVWCSRLPGTNNLTIKSIFDEHTCGNAVRNKLATVKYLAEKYVNKVRRNPKITLQDFIGTVQEDIGVEINTVHAWRAIKAAGQLLFGNEVAQFGKLWNYANELRDAMPGSTIIAQCHESRFERMYFCLSPLKEGFKAGCRKFVCLDGCFLKGAFKGQLLAAIGSNGNNGIYPIAWAVVEVENTSNWTWFVRLLKEDFMMDERESDWLLMTD